jgi:hypothetical protein
MAKEIFKEKQRFHNWEVIGLLAFLALALTYKFFDQQWIHPVADPMSLTSYLILMLPMTAALWYFLSLRLTVRITDKYISLKPANWMQKKRKIKWDDVEECEVLKTSPTAQWSGWNISFNHEKIYSFSGRTGLHLKTKKGDDFLIGAKKCEELEQAVRQAFRGQ